MSVTISFLYNRSQIGIEYQKNLKKIILFRFFAFAWTIVYKRIFQKNIMSLSSNFSHRFIATTNCLQISIANTEIEDRIKVSVRERFTIRSFTRMMVHLKSSAITSFFQCRFVGRSVSLTEQGNVRMKVRRDMRSVLAIELSTEIDVGKTLLCFGFIMRFRADRGWSLDRSWGAWYSLHPCDYFCATGDLFT